MVVASNCDEHDELLVLSHFDYTFFSMVLTNLSSPLLQICSALCVFFSKASLSLKPQIVKSQFVGGTLLHNLTPNKCLGSVVV